MLLSMEYFALSKLQILTMNPDFILWVKELERLLSEIYLFLIL